MWTRKTDNFLGVMRGRAYALILMMFLVLPPARPSMLVFSFVMIVL
ncbi:unnamed protein product [Amoebophrya sp. A25]|nr:unnamed protein product [Amoebophrya sp. A25]|eukprot:GSA25T00004840001.1